MNLNVASHLSFAFVKNQFPFTLSSVAEYGRGKFREKAAEAGLMAPKARGVKGGSLRTLS